MVNDNAENVASEPIEAAIVEAPIVDAPEVKAGKPEKPDPELLRKSLVKNFKQSGDTSISIDGSASNPAQNKSFVNGENQQQVKPPETIIAPASMNAEEKRAWEALPIESKKFLSRREYETRSYLTLQTQELGQKEKEISDVLSAVTPEVRAEYTREGIAIPDLVRRSIAWDKRVKEGIDGALEYLQAYGYSPEQLLNYRSQAPEAPEYLTKEQALEIAREEFRQQNELNQQSAVAEEKANALISFLNSKPIFKGDPNTAAQVESAVAEELEYLMFRGVQASTPQLLETAYQRAITNNPALSNLRPQAAPQQIAKQEDINQQMERVRQAKAASRSANGSLGSGSPAYKSNSLRESLERNYAKS